MAATVAAVAAAGVGVAAEATSRAGRGGDAAMMLIRTNLRLATLAAAVAAEVMAAVVSLPRLLLLLHRARARQRTLPILNLSE